MGVNLPNDEAFLTTEEVIEYLQVNLRTIYRLIKAGKLPAVRVGRQWRFRRRDVDAWLESQRSSHHRQLAPAVVARNGRRRVLVVDDEPSMRELMSKILALGNYDVDTASDGSIALDRMRALSYDLLIADLKMPGMDGLTLLRHAKRLRANLPVIIITGFSTESNAIEALNLRASKYLKKPFGIPQVLEAAAEALGAPAA